MNAFGVLLLIAAVVVFQFVGGAAGLIGAIVLAAVAGVIGHKRK